MDETTAKDMQQLHAWIEAWNAVAVTGRTRCWHMTLDLDGVRRTETFGRKSRPGAAERAGFLRRCGF